MNAVWAFCRNGDRHFGHLDGWGQGFAVIGGTRIDGVVFIDSASSSGGGTSAPASDESDATDGARTPGVAPSTAGLSVGPVDATSVTDGQGKSAGPPLYGCRCGHSRHHHGPFAHCRMPGCLCDVFRSATANAGRSSQRPAS